MALHGARADRASSRLQWHRTILFALAAVVLSLGIAACLTGSNLHALVSAALPSNTDLYPPSSSDRLSPTVRVGARNDDAAFNQRFVPMAEPRRTTAREALASRWMPEDFRPAIIDDEPRATSIKTATATSGIPLPRPRPVAADQVVQPTMTTVALANTNRPADRSFMQKLSDMMPGKLTLASLTPSGALFGKGPDLAAFGYDANTAVYDISAHAVYLPSGTVLEAHSGLGGLRDDPDHVSVPNAGATPPAVYDLKPREKEFHGVQALRMTPTEGSDIFGRSGLLTHSFMLGPKGDSNGCISIKDYDRFLKAYNDGEFTRIAVVTSLKSAPILAYQNPN